MFQKGLLTVLAALGVLFFINLLMISSLAPAVFVKQLFSWILGIILFIIGTKVNPRQIASSKNLIFIVSILAVLAPILLNNITRGSRRWIDIGIGTLQPSELIKPWLMLFLTNTRFPLLIFIPVAAIMLQPDLGSALSVLMLIVPIVLYDSRLQKYLLLIGLGLLAVSPFIWNNLLHDYQRNRVTHFLNPESDPLGKGYNVIQSKIAIGSGGFFGKGYRQGSQGQLLFLPEKHTDFMFAATAEELGLVGIAIILLAYFFLIRSLINRAYSITQNRQLFLFTLGIAIQIWAQLFVNIGMNLGILPVTGIPLPFLSVGGSSLMALMFSLGVIFSS